MSSFKYLLALLSLLTFHAKSQEFTGIDKSDEQAVLSEEDQTPIPFLSSAALLIDYGKLFGQFLDAESKYELGTQFELKNRFVVLGEYGYATLNPAGAYQNTDYESEGSYFRVGLGYKIDMTTKNNLYFSVRYAKALYSDRGVIDITSASGIFNDLIYPFERTGLSAEWYELSMSSEARLWKGLYAGFHLRLRIMNKYDQQEPLDVYAIPGYGRTFDRSIPALNLYLKYAFERF
ncbi:DUF6048 family protein [Reichenbachiella sp.]|uniref:DUF6048 family protein n=1 Tax=Reichenbachiella sp. TaxID=2184521 RepID=UPI0032983F00